MTTFSALLMVLFTVAATGQSPDPHVGTWKLNITKSTYNPGLPPRSGTSVWVATGAGTKVTTDSVQGHGSMAHWEYTTDYDGKDTPVTGNSPYGDTVARTRTDANTIQTIFKWGGKITTTMTSVVSADGKSRTVTVKGVNQAGQPLNNVLFYERQ